MEIVGPPQYFANGKSYDLQIWHAHRPWAVLAPGPQIGPKLGVAWGRHPISKFWDPLNISQTEKLRSSNLART